MKLAALRFDPRTGLVMNIEFHPSPNCDERPINTEINLLVIHNISLPPKEFGTNAIDDFFLNRLNYGAHPYFQTITTLKVSSHLLIRRDGQMVQYVPLHKRAWHAGQSIFQEQSQCNDFSIGIELEGADDIPYTMAQYQQLAHVTLLLLKHYPQLNQQRIVGHSDIAPNRKTDPGPAFDWQYYFRLLEEV